MARKSIITHIEAQAERIISQYEALETEYAALNEEREQLRVKVREQEEQLRELKAEVQRLRLAESLAGGDTTDKTKSRARINLLLREVDKCIALLTKAQQN
jgi:septal ring factor EnvC (AmiA/AmiB activator)